MSLPILLLNVIVDVREVIKTPLVYSISSVKLGFTVHYIWLPESNHGSGKNYDDYAAPEIEDILEDFKESVTLSQNLLDKGVSNEYE